MARSRRILGNRISHGRTLLSCAAVSNEPHSLWRKTSAKGSVCAWTRSYILFRKKDRSVTDKVCRVRAWELQPVFFSRFVSGGCLCACAPIPVSAAPARGCDADPGLGLGRTTSDILMIFRLFTTDRTAALQGKQDSDPVQNTRSGSADKLREQRARQTASSTSDTRLPSFCRRLASNFPFHLDSRSLVTQPCIGLIWLVVVQMPIYSLRSHASCSRASK